MHGTQGARRRAMPFPLIRRAGLALVVTFISLAGHAAGRGALPGLLGLLLVILLATTLTVGVCSQRRSWAYLLAYLLAVQLLIHAVLVLAVPHGSGMASMSLLPTGQMALSHLVASLVAAVVLARGEDTLDAWARLLSARTTWLLPTLETPVGAVATCTCAMGWSSVASERSPAVQRRGPPVAACA